uniref:HMA domain-containing protein n=1 Tax=Anthurium amnicola TaxID=1678845 RepID=A0A1D1YCR7_9ARAE
MAKEEDVKKIELKVSVDCCEGCRKKVLKALSIKGVLKTDIHPTLPKVTVLGNVEPQTLIKRLAKCGKTAEVWPAEPKKPENTEKGVSEVPVTSGNEKAKDSAKKSGGSEPESNQKPGDKNKAKQSDPNRCTGDGDQGEKKAQKEAEKSGCEVVKNINPNCTAATLPTTITSFPQVSYMANHSMVQDSGNVAPPYARVYYAMEPYPIPATYYTSNAYAAPPPPCCIGDHCYYDSLSVHHHPPPPPTPSVPSLPPQFGDYFNDENTVGCSVM